MEQNPHNSPEQEPTVLDLYKSVTKDWSSFFNFIRSLWDARRREELNSALVMEVANPVEEEILEPPRANTFPWRSMLALLLALAAQGFVEPPSRQGTFALVVYFLAAGMALWAYFKNELHLPALPAVRQTPDPLSTRLFPLIAAVILALIAFFDFGEGEFTVINTALWTLSIGLLAYSLWLSFPKTIEPVEPDARRKAWVRNGLILVVLGISIFFRFYKTASVPVEPFSDHSEKILDVYEITQGNTFVFFERNTGREAIQMYWTLAVAYIFNTGFSFLSLKLGTALLGLFTIPYVYLLGKEYGNERTALFALFLFGIAAWPNIISRIGLRFPLYPLFLAPTFFYLIRGLRTRNRNDFILSGIFLGLGLHGYSPFRIVPVFVVVAFFIYFLHLRSKEVRPQVLWWLIIIVVMSIFVFSPLMRYWVSHPEMFGYRAFSRLSSLETPLPGPAWQIFLSNLYKGLLMFNWDDGEIWVNSVTHRPALDLVTAALFVLGLILLVVRYIRQRDWRDLVLLVSIPVLIMPSVLSLAFPGENPALNRAGGAAVPAILISALALEGLVSGFGVEKKRQFIAYGITGLLFAASAYSNYDLVFRQFANTYALSSWNTSELGKVISEFEDKYGQTDSAWIVPYPYWVDTRLPGVWAGIPDRDFALFPDHLSESLTVPAPKMFIYWREDLETEKILKELYPNGKITRYTSAFENKDFFIFMVEE
ncbi:MAG: glycosyltransferase family 39 protein [Anaerolineales bacterium]|nr:glycosyltransferase family 39 protein [Anaerolineales bacterium]